MSPGPIGKTKPAVQTHPETGGAAPAAVRGPSVKGTWLAPARAELPRLHASELADQPYAARVRLVRCLRGAGNIMPGEKGDHIKAIQEALTAIRSRSLPDLPEIKDPPGVFGTSTASAIEKYKAFNAIPMPAQPFAAVVDAKTVARIDSELVNKPAPAALIVPEITIKPHEIEFGGVNDNLGKDDLTFRPTTSNLSGSALLRVVEMREKSTAELEAMVMREFALADATLGPRLAQAFFSNTKPPSADFAITFPHGSDLSVTVSGTERFGNWSNDILARLDHEIKGLGKSGAIDASKLEGRVSPDILHWHPRNAVETAGILLGAGPSFALKTGHFVGEQAKMLALIGSFQGAHVYVDDLVIDPQTNKYRATVTFELIDHYGVDGSDLDQDAISHGSDGVVAFWVLQHERHKDGHMPFRLKVQIKREVEGSL